MTTATARVLSQLQCRRVGDSKYRARCPVHGGKSTTSLSIKDAGDRVLLHCHAGCELPEILNALDARLRYQYIEQLKQLRIGSLDKPQRQGCGEEA